MPVASAALAAFLAAGAFASEPPASFDAAIQTPVASLRSAPGESGFLSFSAAGPVLPPYKIFVPPHLRAPAALVVVLHGCGQDADAIAASTRWNVLAEKEGFLVLYPNQQWGLNPFNCWNWYLPINEAPGIGEPAAVMTAIEAAKAHYPIDASRVFVAGISAGGATAATLLSCYPGSFAAGAVHSGVAYGLAADAFAAQDVMRNGPAGRARRGGCDPSSFHGGVLVVQGSADTAINPLNAERLAADFAGTHAARTVAAVPPRGEAYGYRLVDLSGSGARVREVLVDGLGHAWSGGAAGASATEARGPDATGMMWSFFSASRPAGRQPKLRP
jgi:poly(hydroxyalkanoate) depolymerase family esterase